ncbi:phosphoacetylglucosamine Mutase [Zygosaccharomyces mellis]|uniref:Phosphoacetylglucosamine mutase n=1 Tax=Zygosaccharomyces mellis TaxID=42258 RepID=A0A4C2EBP3_9SACH|nr:phosphoacetylglucosamine Mutase [Zygosaccharomyces mellis]
MLSVHTLAKLIDQYCSNSDRHYVYGTAGFRGPAATLDTVLFATGIIACLRSLALNGDVVGVMVTASHNPPVDNGVKVVEPDGSMMPELWEPLATQLANTLAIKGSSNERAQATLSWFEKELKDQLQSANKFYNEGVVPTLVVARDSRESGPKLLSCLVAGAKELFHAKIHDFGLLTTPQLHFLTSETAKGVSNVTELRYYRHFLQAWNHVAQLHGIGDHLPTISSLTIDAANGIGAPKVQELLSQWACRGQVHFINNKWTNPELLNHECGADFVKSNQRFPLGFNDSKGLGCSYDGDADRVVFYYVNESNKFCLLDGDRISALFAHFFSSMLKQAGLQSQLSLGIVQTAYANGNSTEYLQKTLQVPVSCVKTGVKHLHHEAVTKYDIGIYFEANGHGTIIFSPKFYKVVKEQERSIAVETLEAFSQLINQTVGDAISDMLGVLAALSISKWTPQHWGEEFTDLPNRLAKVIVPDRSVFITTDQERRLTKPEGLQAKIDETVKCFQKGRSFVRASGTEDAVRVYAEAANVEEVEQLTKKVKNLVMNSSQN